MKTGHIRDFIVEFDLEEDLINFVPKLEKIAIKEWLKSEDLSYWGVLNG